MLRDMLLYGTLAVCAVLAAIMVYRYDLYDREPWYMLMLATALGAGAMYGAGQVQIAVLAKLGNFAATHWNVTLSAAAATTEEFGKLAAVFIIATICRRHFNDPMDGIIYGSFAGLGAALEESVALLGWSARMWEMLPAQEPIRLLGHLIMGGIGAFGVGMVRPGRRPRCWLAFWVAWGFAIAIHFVWDIVAFSAADLGRMLAWHKAAAVTIMLGGLAVYWRLVAVAERISKEWFQGDSTQGAAHSTR